MVGRPVDDQSERDFAVACFALEHGAEPEEAEGLVAAARRYADDGKRKEMRADYLHRTVDAARAKTRERDTGRS